MRSLIVKVWWCVSVMTLGMSSGCTTNPNQCEDDLACFAREQCVQNICVLLADSVDQGGNLPLADMADGVDGGLRACKTDGQCEEGWRCNMMLSRCEEGPAGPACSFESPCEDDASICEGGTCQPGNCVSDEACGFARLCELGACTQPGWEFAFSDGETGEVPDALRMQLVEDGKVLVYASQSLLAQSNTSARLKATLDLYAGSDMLQAYFEQGEFTFSLVRGSYEQPEGVLVGEGDGAMLVEGNHISWRGETGVIMADQTTFFLRMSLKGDVNPDVPVPLQDLSDESVISLDFSRGPDDVGRGYPVRLRYEP